MKVFCVLVEGHRGMAVDLAFYFVRAKDYQEAGAGAIAGACHGACKWRNEDRTSIEDSNGHRFCWDSSEEVDKKDVAVIEKYQPVFPWKDLEEWINAVEDYESGG